MTEVGVGENEKEKEREREREKRDLRNVPYRICDDITSDKKERHNVNRERLDSRTALHFSLF